MVKDNPIINEVTSAEKKIIKIILLNAHVCLLFIRNNNKSSKQYFKHTFVLKTHRTRILYMSCFVCVYFLINA